MIFFVNIIKEEFFIRIIIVYLDFKLFIFEGNYMIDSMFFCEGCNERVCCIYK